HAAVMESGWLERLERDPMHGLPRAANVLEAISFVRELVHDMGLGISRAAYEFDVWLDSVKNGPASLSGNELDAVSVMTVHASKGLQFKVVGVSECLRDPYRESSALVMAPIKDGVVWGLAPSGYRVEENRKAGVENEYDRLCTIDEQAEKEERGRLIYVALTRAEEALVVGLSLDSTKNRPAGTGTDIADRCARAIVGASGVGVFQTPSEKEFGFGGYTPGLLRVRGPIALPGADAQDPSAADDMEAAGDARLIDARTDDGFLFQPYELPVASTWRASGDSYSFSSASAILDMERGDPEHRTPELKLEVDEDLSEERQASFESFDEDRATDFGSAMHMACQVMAEGAYPFGAMLPKERLDAIATWCRMPEEGSPKDRSAARGLKSRADLARAVERWSSCDVRSEALSWPRLRAEVPFFTKAESRFGSVVTGFIDLLADDPANHTALVVDYKSGNLAFTPEGFEADHAMQANFYAWVLMKEGYEAITCKFVALQRDDGEPSGQPLVATYAFDGANPPKLDW
ncbi:MAG: PD-(D/E)XK nuclease family protein, partial [Atopobiaceae bacterium]|nr:PD-(D/E)XK nuclease family protein [Atopobiaceae bacterium]